MRIPRIRSKGRGYYVRWGGKDHYLGASEDAAIDRYTNCDERGLPAWRRWREQRSSEPRRRYRGLTVDGLAEQFIANRRAEGGADRAEFYRKHLQRFRLAFGVHQAAMVRPLHLHELKETMLPKYAPATINKDLTSVQTMYRWASSLELVPYVDFSGVKKLPLGERPDRTMTPGQVRAMIDAADGRLKPWLAVNYLCGARPIEVVRAVHTPNWVERGVLRVPNKVAQRTRQPRMLLFSVEALEWFRKCRPHWSRLDSYSAYCRKKVDRGPHTLRHSAGTHLLQRGVQRSDADAILGHYPADSSLRYMPMQWRSLRRLAARLTLRD